MKPIESTEDTTGSRLHMSFNRAPFAIPARMCPATAAEMTKMAHHAASRQLGSSLMSCAAQASRLPVTATTAAMSASVGRWASCEAVPRRPPAGRSRR